jgi:hypothetical protein
MWAQTNSSCWDMHTSFLPKTGGIGGDVDVAYAMRMTGIV